MCNLSLGAKEIDNAVYYGVSKGVSMGAMVLLCDDFKHKCFCMYTEAEL